VLTNDNLPADNDTYTAALVTAPSQGTLVLNPNGTFTFTPAADFTGGNVIFTYQVNDNGYAPASSNVATVTINYPAPAILPLKLLNFSANKEASAIKISWKVGENETGDFFVVEKSTDGKNFTAISTVAANGFKGISEYTATDKASHATTYYRLKMVNKDNSVTYSKVVIVKGEDEAINVHVLNNPASTQLNITFTSDKQMNSSFKVYSMSGAQVYQATMNTTAGTNNISVPVNQLQNGAYVLVVDSIHGKKAIQFVKK
jgi:hypothetical protein